MEMLWDTVKCCEIFGLKRKLPYANLLYDPILMSHIYPELSVSLSYLLKKRNS
jgi:hypothetical protein